MYVIKKDNLYWSKSGNCLWAASLNDAKLYPSREEAEETRLGKVIKVKIDVKLLRYYICFDHTFYYKKGCEWTTMKSGATTFGIDEAKKIVEWFNDDFAKQLKLESAD
jgi:hypothetical protein